MKICRRCNTVKPIDSFYKCKGMKDGHFNICKDCNIIQGQKYRKIKSLDEDWLIKNRERRKKYKQSSRNPLCSNMQNGHIWEKYRNKICIIPRYQLHHWNYNLRFSVFYIHPSIHHKFHTLAKLNSTEKIFYFAGEPLDNKEKHEKILNWINTHFEYNYKIINYELDNI